MQSPFIIGGKLYLRGLKRSDLEGNYFAWLDDREVTQFMDSGVFPNAMEKMEDFYRSTVLSHDNAIFAIVDKKTDKHIGNIKLGPINWISRFAPLGIMIGNKEFWGKGYGTEAIGLVVDYAFNRLNLHKVVAGVISINHGSVKAFQKAGFETEGTFKSQFFHNGTYYDSLYLSIVNKNS